MRLKNVPGSREAIAESRFVIHDPQEHAGNWAEVFGRTAPLHIEIGMGKGRFLMEMAALHPDIDYVGIEKYSSVLIRAVQKMEEKELSNVRFIRMDAEEITEVFGAGEVDRIYLNFSDPWPKDRHAKRRLPSRQFLARYEKILKPEGKIEFKTDNRPLFDFALEELEPAGWQAEEVTYDLHSDERLMKGNVMTEYEARFSAAGNPICKYIIRKKTGQTADRRPARSECG
ncbi:MAG TPA: tRNA (guanosine(46)-N7)-methyltransferase TrmB [Candidatus Eisenbergiella merdipullorum]|uniref:tRNA (guanine-N(7)-)-methyltransferase n=1 Tax=Candidatus Eisenbergiella merdipullorum TaxID=2838553 RepID=A0A9D2I608_9FIRM|nr:tRNA (guanosine(46)-N7)-methyltransferase TrmB [Candidatus Eisenbergiella merdipullorum]